MFILLFRFNLFISERATKKILWNILVSATKDVLRRSRMGAIVYVFVILIVNRWLLEQSQR